MRNLFLVFFIQAIICISQNTNTVQGILQDEATSNPLTYPITVQLIGDTSYVTNSDSTGFFMIPNVKFGEYSFLIDDETLEKVVIKLWVEGGNQTKLKIKIKELVTRLDEVILEEKTPNPYKMTSSYSFSNADFRKSSASLGDPARMIEILPGVIPNINNTNGVSVRGNSSINNNWYLNEIEIPNPNHFGAYGATGGFIGVFNESNLEGFDFYLGGYPAMYGNSNSAVFDLKMRKGNRLKRESNAKLSLVGLSGTSEGYFLKNSKATYLVNAKVFDLGFSSISKTLEANQIAVPSYKDYSYMFHIPLSLKTNVSFWGFGSADELISRYSVYRDRLQSYTYCNNISLDWRINEHSKLNTTIQVSNTKNHKEFFVYDQLNTENLFYSDLLRVLTYYNLKVNRKLKFKIGTQNTLKYDKVLAYTSNQPTYELQSSKANGYINQNYITGMYAFNSKSSVILGIHTIYTNMNQRINIEPRVGFKYRFNPSYTLNLSAGAYSRLQPSYIYRFTNLNREPNMKSLHLNMSHELDIDGGLSFKIEAYFQQYMNVFLRGYSQVDSNSTILNNEEYVGTAYMPDGIAQNYGIEVYAIKKIKRYAFTLSGSLFDAKYRDYTDTWKNTQFNNNFNLVIQVAKDHLKKTAKGMRTITFSTKCLYYGGHYAIPIFEQASRVQQKSVYDFRQIYSDRLPNNFRVDLGIQLSYSRKKTKHDIRLDIQNMSNHKNVLKKYFDPLTQQIDFLYQMPILPILSYAISF